jgi:hypothetical protein
MMGSFEEGEDLVQETFLRAWHEFDGLDAIRPLLHEGLTAPGEWRLPPTRANRQPTAASYLRAPGDTEFRAFKLDVLRLEGGASPRSPPPTPPCSARSASRQPSDSPPVAAVSFRARPPDHAGAHPGTGRRAMW